MGGGEQQQRSKTSNNYIMCLNLRLKWLCFEDLKCVFYLALQEKTCSLNNQFNNIFKNKRYKCQNDIIRRLILLNKLDTIMISTRSLAILAFWKLLNRLPQILQEASAYTKVMFIQNSRYD